MDMWEPYIKSTHQYLPDAASKIVFDKFHVALHLNKAVDLVRRQEHHELMGEGKTWLKGTKYDWLRNPDNFSLKATRAFNRCVSR
jgi:transposase